MKTIVIYTGDAITSGIVAQCMWIHTTFEMSQRRIVVIWFKVRLFSSPSSSWIFISYHSDHRFRTICSEENDRVLYLQSHTVSKGTSSSALLIKRVEYLLLFLGRRNSTDLLTHMRDSPDISIPVSTAVQDTLPTEFTTASTSSPNNVSLQMNTQSLPSPSQAFETVVPSYFSGDHIYHRLKYLERLLDCSLATAAVIHFSGNTLADILTPRAQDTLYALLALNMLLTSSKPRVRDTPAHSASSDFDIGNDQCPFHHSLPPLPNSSPLVLSTACTINISISMDYKLNVLFSWTAFAVFSVSFLAFFIINFSGFSGCEKDVGGLS